MICFVLQYIYQGLGRLNSVLFNWANTFPADIVFRSVCFVSISATGGRPGKLLHGILELKLLILNKSNFYTRFYNERKFLHFLPSFFLTVFCEILILNQHYIVSMCSNNIFFLELLL
jgi:hypothetical protein